MNRLLCLLLLASTLMASEAYNPSTGYIDHAGIVVSSTHLAGFATSPAIGSISLGNRTDTASFTYANTAADNYGVNNDGAGNLSGKAWSPVVGWITFDPATSGVVIDPKTGAFSGYAYNENIGWISFAGEAGDGSNYGVVGDWKMEETAIVDKGETDGKKLKPGITVRTNPVTTGNAELMVSTPASSTIRLAIFDNMGKILDEQEGESLSNGKPRMFTWDCRNRGGASVTNGNYLAVAVVKCGDGSVKQLKAIVGVKR